MKNIKKLSMLLLIVFVLFTACTNSENDEIIFEVEQEEYDMEDILSYTLKTNSKDTFSFGSDFIIEKKEDDTWTIYNDNIPSTMELNYINNDLEYRFNREIPIKDYIQEPGSYRLHKIIHNNDKDKSFDVYAEFIVK